MSAEGSDSSAGDGSVGLRVEVLSVVFQVRETQPDTAPALCVLLTKSSDAWALPGGDVGAAETLSESARRLLADKMDVRKVAHLEQLSVFSDPHRVPGIRTIASTYIGLVPTDAPARLPAEAAWHEVDALPSLAYDHADIIAAGRHRVAAKLSYTNIAFALAPARFPMSELSEIYCAALGYAVDTTNLLRILSRRAVVVSTGTVGKTGRTGGRPPALYAFADNELRVTDEFATLRPPM
ncbi:MULTISPECIES: NUDIX domain-containing protein [unclassified Gordonia (in: high G+C Gram-positive bacteria)]|uniref:NUDIX hydrolase n=1 Tax=unclassified Gordonia (in: high G+C Gram-positive bacteria) TaxID=2657482 RepID=UPI001F0D0C41|nr:NUDIX domain-containing protein [Gordonia sp. ABSL49_1]MCH5641520.1 NUDIX hydrolase [Gordonia sp. ABSL49_1]